MVLAWTGLFVVAGVVIVVVIAVVVVAAHPRNGVSIISVDSVCLYLCLSVCQTITFESLDVFEVHTCTFGVTLETRVKFVYEEHRVMVKVTGAEQVQNAYTLCPEKRCHFIFACNSAKC